MRPVMTSQKTELPQLPDEVLKRMGLTRERWEQMQEEHGEREALAPNVGDQAADFELPRLGDTSEKVRLSGFRGKRPVGLIFGSYT